MRRSGWGSRAATLVGLYATIGFGLGEAQAQTGNRRDVTLSEAIRLALTSNRELETARLQLAGAEGQVREAWSAVYPSINASASYTRNLEVPGQFLPARIFDPNAGPDDLTLVRFGSDNNWFGQVRLEQPIFRAGVFLGLSAASRFQLLQEEVVRGQEQAIVTRTKQRYFDVLLAEESVRLNEESVRRVRQALAETQAMHRAGLVGDYDVLRLEVELANLEPALQRAQNAAEAARRTLAVDLAMEGDLVDVAGSLAAVDVVAGPGSADPLVSGFGVAIGPTSSVAALIEQARGNRSDLRQVGLTEELRRTELRAEQAEYLPEISFFATYGYSAQADGGVNPFGFGSGNSVTTPQAGIQVTVPIFNGFARPARIEQRRATLRQTETQGRQVAAQVENEVQTLYDQVEESRLSAQAQQEAVARATRGYEIASAQFREGLGSRLELTDAEVALRQTEFNLAQAVHDYLTARARLDQAVGVVPEVD
jgi:outer membrane protein